mmetsp:Transcript_4432/g.9831  ORF Transcript_4432/g.9831 Transcript_4432/m.9831 type:complete len:598 (-) Transcript_4432:110-1903(-)
MLHALSSCLDRPNANANLTLSMARLLWHRRDLRIHDNELYQCHAGAQKIYSLFIFDPSDYSPRPTGIPDGRDSQLLSVTHGPHFTRRLLDAVHSLRHSLQNLGGNLLVRNGNPLEVIPQLARELQVEEVAWSEAPGHFECTQSEKLKKILLRDGPCRCRVYTTCSLTLTHPNDLPTDQFTWQKLARPKEKRKKRKSKAHSDTDADAPMQAINNHYELSSTITNVSPSRFAGMPTIMGDFRRVARTSAPARELFEKAHPQNIAQDFSDIDIGDIPSLEVLTEPILDTTEPILGCLPKELILKLIQSAKEIPRDPTINIEEQSIQHLQHFVQNHAATADRSLCDVSNNDSSRLSIPLALGTLSPQQVYHCVRQQQDKLESQNDGQCTINPAELSWLISHMEMRDFFIFNSFRNGLSEYRLYPTKPVHKPNEPREWFPLSENKEKFIRWASGHTNLPLVDAGMKELLSTGYTSNRVRQNMASVLAKDLQLDWRLGAEFYQLCLEDHCVAANFGNWAYFAGVGGDPKSRHFRTCSQALRYDSDGRHVRQWIDRLRECSEDDVEVMLRPWDFQKDWPMPIVPPDTQFTWQDKEKLKNTGKIS